MNIVVPMAGRGSRFKEKGYADPKPLIDINGKTMVEWAISCLTYKPKELIFIILKKQVEEFKLDKKLKSIFGDAIRIIVTDGVTDGAACTVLLAKEYINNDNELIVYNADQYFNSDVFLTIQEKKEDVKGVIPVFRSTHTKWSYAKVEDGYVTETAEKVPISPYATVGMYYFTQGKDFVWAAEQMIEKDLRRNNEFYVCPVYNELIGRGDKIIIHEVEKMWGLGTPEDVEYFKKYFKNGGNEE